MASYFHRSALPGWWYPDKLEAISDFNGGVYVYSRDNVMFSGSQWLFDKCWNVDGL